MLEVFHSSIPSEVQTRRIPIDTSSQDSNHQIKLLPNPLLHIYVFEHFTTSDHLWVPGYWTAIKLYEVDHLALTTEFFGH